MIGSFVGKCFCLGQQPSTFVKHFGNNFQLASRYDLDASLSISGNLLEVFHNLCRNMWNHFLRFYILFLTLHLFLFCAIIKFFLLNDLVLRIFPYISMFVAYQHLMVLAIQLIVLAVHLMVLAVYVMTLAVHLMAVPIHLMTLVPLRFWTILYFFYN